MKTHLRDQSVVFSLVCDRVCLVTFAGLLLIPTSLSFAQATASAPVQAYSFDGDLSKLSKDTGPHPEAVPKKVDPKFEPSWPLPAGPADPVWQTKGGGKNAATLGPGVTPPQFTTPNPNFDTGVAGDGPPDDNMAVGPNHVITMVNFTYQIFDKKGTLPALAGPANPASLWASAPVNDPCRNQRGDPYVVYDHLADRFVMSYFANDPTKITMANPDPLGYECIAVAKTANPVTGGWFVYTFNLGVSNDYPKIAVWPDGYYMISQRGYDGTSSLDAWVFDRANMLNGNPATFQHPSGFPSEHDVITLPSDLTGPAPPAGSPNFFARPYDGTLYGDGAPRIEVFEFHTDWGNPANTTFALKQTIAPATFRSDICAGTGLDQFCVPQPNTTSKLDALSIWPMGPLQYRNFGDHETLLFSHAVNADGMGLVGIRWHELRRSPVGTGSWTLFQEGTFAPADSTTTTTASIQRWTSSIAMDQAGNIAMGYNVSNDGIAPHPTVFPGVRIVGRLSTDPLGEMTTPEVDLADGGSSITCRDKSNNIVGCRWGDYAAMRVDPSDGCRFWYTTEYEPTSGQNTRVGAVRFPTCNPADLAVTKTGPSTIIAGNQITYTITVTNKGPSNATNVIVQDVLPSGVTFVSSTVACTSGTLAAGCNIGSLANGASATFTVLAQVSSALTGLVTNTVTVSADQFDPNTADDTASATTTVTASADLAVAKTCKPDVSSAVAGAPAYCSIVVTNYGPSDATAVSLTDTIVASTPFNIVSAVGATCTSSTGTNTKGNVACNLGTMKAGATATVTVTFNALNGGDIDDTATVSSSTPDPTSTDNSATGTVHYISSADLSVTKTSAPNPVVAGTNLTYTITAANAGPSTAANVVVKDTLPAQVSVVSATSSAGSCSGGIPGNPAQPLICTLGSMNSGGTASITVVVKVNSSTPDGTILVNNASISSDTSDPNNKNNVATASAPVVARGDLAIVKTSDALNYKPSSVITYTVKVTNNGPSDSLAVVVTDNLPDFKQATYQSDTGGCTLSSTTLTCNLGNMPLGTSKSFNIYELVNGNQGAVSNTASVASSTTDPNAANNTSTRVVTVGH